MDQKKILVTVHNGDEVLTYDPQEPDQEVLVLARKGSDIRILGLASTKFTLHCVDTLISRQLGSATQLLSSIKES